MNKFILIHYIFHIITLFTTRYNIFNYISFSVIKPINSKSLNITTTIITFSIIIWKTPGVLNVLNCYSLRTIRGFLPMSAHEDSSVSPTKEPWKELGISRRTYFNRKKAGTLGGADVSASANLAPTNVKPPHRFKAGEPSANPAGRPKGTRNKLSERTVQKLFEHFEEHGADAIARVCKENPAAYLNAIVRLVPQQVEVGEAGAFAEMSDEEVKNYIAQKLSRLPALAEQHRLEHAVH